ncbi:MAG TPA: AAA family ATPase [Hyphomicrobiales bacterium]|nr:AAA family ATPase [Hyphomicrobiales bacterium]
MVKGRDTICGAVSDCQTEVIGFLSNPVSYPGGVSEVKRIDTHAAIVFLAGDRAYKLKRAVKLPYLDFSTLEKRRATLAHELEINSKISPEIYLSIVPIVKGKKGIRLGGAGKVLDWLLVMRRFGEEALFDRIAAEGRLERQCVEELAREVGRFHRQAEAKSDGTWVKNLEKIAGDLEGALTGREAERASLHFKSYINKMKAELTARIALLSAREQAGFVRRCHGDLHLGNIVLWNGKPKLFDAIEFDDTLATIDVLYDLAFLLMDLWHRRCKTEANMVFNHWMRGASNPELEGLALLPLYLSMRAAIRAMTGVHSLAFRQGKEREQTINGIIDYGRLAERFLERRRPYLVAIGGLSGTGKSTAAQEIAPFVGAAPGALHLRTDVERKLMYGVAIDGRLPPGAYAGAVSYKVYQRVFEKAESALRHGHSAVVDAVFPDSGSRVKASEIAQRTDATFAGFWMDAPAWQIKDRVAARRGDASDAGVEIVEQQLKTVWPAREWIRVDASGEAGQAASAILRVIDEQAEKEETSLKEQPCRSQHESNGSA